MLRKINSSSADYRSFTGESRGILSDWIDKRQTKLSDKICLFGKSFNYGTDDPLIVSVISIVLRATWLALGIFLYVYYNIQPGCRQKHRPEVLTASLTGLLIYQITGLASALICMVVSLFGTLIHPKPRRPVIGILHFLVLLYLIEFPWLIYSTYVCFSPALRQPNECEAFKKVIHLFYAAVALSWLVYLVIIVAFAIDIDPCQIISKITHWKNLQIEFSEEDPAHMTKTRENRCAAFLMIMFKRTTRVAMADAVRAMGVIFGNFNATFSDLVAGFMLMRLQQMELFYQGKSSEMELNQATVDILKRSGTLPMSYETPNPVPLTRKEAQEFSAKCLHYIKYSFASYGGVYSLGTTKAESFRVLCKATRGCVCCSRYQAKFHVKGESQFTNTTIISAAISLPQDCIAACSFSNEIFQAPLFATYNPQKYELIVAIQGSTSVQDALTNVSISSLKVPGLGGVENAYVHRGFYKTALTAYNELLNTERFIDVLQNKRVEKFLFTGHSLGASVATIMSILFKDNHKTAPWESKIQTLGFNVPAPTMSYTLAEKVKSFVTSVVAPHDVVSRISLRSLSYFKIVAETLLVTVNCHKQQALCCSERKWYLCCPPDLTMDEEFVGLSYVNHDIIQHTQKNPQDPSRISKSQTSLTKQLENSSRNRNLADEFLSNLSYERSLAWEDPKQPMLFIPGKILHLEVPNQYRTSNSGWFSTNGAVKGSWKARESLSTILIHPDMLEDHTLLSMFHTLQRLE